MGRRPRPLARPKCKGCGKTLTYADTAGLCKTCRSEQRTGGGAA